MARTWRYAELELRYGGGHERPTRIRWSPPNPHERISLGFPAETDPLTTLIARMGGPSDVNPEDLFEVHLLNAIGLQGWRLVDATPRSHDTATRVRYLFMREEDDADA